MITDYRPIVCIAAIALLTACGQNDNPPSTTATTQESQPARPASGATEQPADDKPAPAITDPDVEYAPIMATLREDGREVRVMIPEGASVSTGSLIEVREGADGKLYYVSEISR